MSTKPTEAALEPMTMEQFVKNIQNGKLCGVKCDCGYATFLTTPLCPQCHIPRDKASKWIPITTKGTIASYCVTYVGPPELADLCPYGSLIVDFGSGLRISAILNQKLDPMNPPSNLIGKQVEVSIMDRPYGKILGMKLS